MESNFKDHERQQRIRRSVAGRIISPTIILSIILYASITSCSNQISKPDAYHYAGYTDTTTNNHEVPEEPKEEVETKAEPELDPEPEPKPIPQKPTTVSYRKLYRDYAENPINADNIYKDKLLRLTGRIDAIDREISSEPYITFEVGIFEDIRITFKKEEEAKIMKLKKGQKVTIQGICQGTLMSTTVALKDCELR